MTKTFDAVDSKHLSYMMRIKAHKANLNDTKNRNKNKNDRKEILIQYLQKRRSLSKFFSIINAQNKYV